MKQYHDILRHILCHGVMKPTRAKLASTGDFIDALSVFGYQARFDLRAGFPAVTTKRLWFHGVLHELLWMLSGATNVRYLHANRVHIWDQWADSEGDIGPGYGFQWRHWPAPTTPAERDAHYRKLADAAVLRTGGVGMDAEIADEQARRDAAAYTVRSIDQIANLVAGIKEVVANPRAPVGRRLILNTWNVADIERMGLPPCHCFAQFSVSAGWLDCQMYQRSADAFLGVPFNIAQYALLTHILAHVTGLKAREFVHAFGDLHIYQNHLEQVGMQVDRHLMALPTLWLDPAVTDIDALRAEHVRLDGYHHHPALPGEVAV